MKYKVFELTPRTKTWKPVGYWLPRDEAFDKASEHAKTTGREVQMRDREGNRWCEWRLEPNHSK